MAQYPMFWVKMEDVAPYLGKLMLMGSSLNNAAMMSADDFFTMNCYQGEIYKAVNLQDRLLANYCPDDSTLKKEQKRIEKQLHDVQEHIYGRDSAYYAKLRADSIAQVQADSLKRLAKVAPHAVELLPAVEVHSTAVRNLLMLVLQKHRNNGNKKQRNRVARAVAVVA
ncbi:MAG: hypothetical protein ACLS29_00535 [Prevotellamassilia sp.]